jgi:hypothetical protein
MSRRAKISRLEELVASKLKAQQERRREWARGLPIHAQRHATAVASITLAGEARIDEPLARAWARALKHYKISVNNPIDKAEQVGAAQRLFPVIVGKQELSSRFAEIFSTALTWLLEFTQTVFDAWILRFRLPQTKPNSNWGTAGFSDAERWPFLPVGVLTAGEPIPHNDGRHITLAARSIVPPVDRIPKDVDLFAPTDPLCDSGTVVDEIAVMFSLVEKPEWSAYDIRRMRKILRLISHEDWADSCLTAPAGSVRLPS